MNEQSTLFDKPLSDPGAVDVGAHHRQAKATELSAAYRVMPRTGTQRMIVLLTIAAAGEYGATDQEIADQSGLYLYSAAPRRNELLRGGWVEDSGFRRDTGRGGNAIAWRLTTRGRFELDPLEARTQTVRVQGDVL